MAFGVEVLTVLLTLCGLVYLLLALWGARAFVREVRRAGTDGAFAPAVSVLKPLKGNEARLYAALASHCRQAYAGEYELVFGVPSLDDPAGFEIDRLRKEFPAVRIKLVDCWEQLGANGKVSSLVQMLRVAEHSFCVINDADILVGPEYLAGVTRYFRDERVGMVTAPYLGAVVERGGLWAKLEALGISTDFMPGVLTARALEGGIRFGLGSTLAVSRTALAKAGGFEAVADYVADDYELGRRIAGAGYLVKLCGEVVETTVPAYRFREFWDHQIRWARSTRDSRRWGYVGLGITYAIPWALLTVLASGAALWSFSLLVLVLFVRVTVALAVGAGVLRDGQVLRDLWLLPVRDCFGFLFWAWSYAGDTVVWRGEQLRLSRGRIVGAATPPGSELP